ncbi:MAG: hypothetical protein MUO39_08330, partial [Steroidobacteraceae bacterium]|nr:hypothetical protein [Steroidobacteraceae bacterium]
MPTTRDLDAELDERMQRFTARGISRAAMLAQLNLAGYPSELLRQRFPEMSNVAFGDAPATTPTSDLPTQSRGITPRDATPAQHLPTDNPSKARSPEAIRASSQTATSDFTPVSASAAATELNKATLDVEQGGGISFHYVPLIQCSFPHADPGESISFT